MGSSSTISTQFQAERMPIEWTPRLNQLLPDIEAQDPQMAELIRPTAEVVTTVITVLIEASKWQSDIRVYDFSLDNI